jgi:hypothetical protein
VIYLEGKIYIFVLKTIVNVIYLEGKIYIFVLKTIVNVIYLEGKIYTSALKTNIIGSHFDCLLPRHGFLGFRV